jgi:hypothetical protein
VAAFVVFYITCFFSVNLYFKQQDSLTIPNAYQQLITYILAIVVIKLLTRRQEFSGLTLPIIIASACMLFYFGSAGLSDNLVTGILAKEYGAAQGIVHWLSVTALIYLLFTLTIVLRKNGSAVSEKGLWPFCIAAVALLSIECRLLYLSVFAQTNTIDIYTGNYLKAGLTITWAVFSFVTIWLGMRYKNRTLRIIALSIFTVALLKLFLFDIRNISEGGKIAAFIMLGILLLVISFMYQRLKKMIIDNEEKKG